MPSFFGDNGRTTTATVHPGTLPHVRKRGKSSFHFGRWYCHMSDAGTHFHTWPITMHTVNIHRNWVSIVNHIWLVAMFIDVKLRQEIWTCFSSSMFPSKWTLTQKRGWSCTCLATMQTANEDGKQPPVCSQKPSDSQCCGRTWLLLCVSLIHSLSSLPLHLSLFGSGSIFYPSSPLSHSARITQSFFSSDTHSFLFLWRLLSQLFVYFPFSSPPPHQFSCSSFLGPSLHSSPLPLSSGPPNSKVLRRRVLPCAWVLIYLRLPTWLLTVSINILDIFPGWGSECMGLVNEPAVSHIRPLIALSPWWMAL